MRNDCGDLIGKTLRAVEVGDEKQLLTLTFDGGLTALFRTYGDCCSQTWIEHFSVPDDLREGATLLAVDEMDEPDEFQDPDLDCVRVYQTKFRTTRGDVVVEYRNASNGYYGGSLDRVRS